MAAGLAPLAGEQLTIDISRPQGVEGKTITVDQALMKLEPGNRVTSVSYRMAVRSSQSEQRQIALPPGAQLQQLKVNGQLQPIATELDHVPLAIVPGSQQIEFNWLQSQPVAFSLSTPLLDTGIASVNSKTHIAMPDDRWVLLAGGPAVGPAVLFWGVLLVMLMLAWGLGKSGYTPLTTWQWLLLGVGLSQAPVLASAVVVAWFFVLAWREKQPLNMRWKFNLLQLVIVVLTLVSALIMLTAVWKGLLGSPDMQITGNGSWGNQLYWYQDRSEGVHPESWVISVPLFVYRLLMLAWSLWLAFAVLRWLQWGWRAFSHQGLWRAKCDKSLELDLPDEKS